MSQRKKHTQESVLPLAFGQGNIILVCYGPVIISDRYAARMLGSLRRKKKFAPAKSTAASPEGPDVPVSAGDTDIARK